MTERVLVVGAGAVGQVFALHLQRGGAEISFFVKPEHRLDAQLDLFAQARERTSLAGFRRLTRIEEIAREKWDQVWLAVPSTALRGAWLEELLKATGDTTVVALAPESERAIPPQRLVLGAIPFMAWQAPLPGEAGAPGVAFWIPPLSRVPLSGERPRVDAVLKLLRGSGLPGKRVRDVARTSAPVTTLLMSFVAALEREGWSFKEFRRAGAPLAAANAREALRIADLGPLWPLLARPWFFRTLTRVGAAALPFDLESYLRFHFTKVGAQTRLLFQHWLEQGRRQGRPTSALEETAAALR